MTVANNTKPVTMPRASTERKTGVIRAVRPSVRTLRVRDGGLDLMRRAA